MRAYLVCATPRSGSTLLCEMLRETGVAGRPLEHFEKLRHSSLPRQPREYFSEGQLPGVLELLAPTVPGTPSREPAQAWWSQIVIEGSGDNGVWGGKLMWGHVEDLLVRARELPGMAGAELESVLDELLDRPQLVFVTRGDKVAQAVSLWRAVQTQSWRASDSSTPEAVAYDFDGIDHLVSLLQSDDRAWREWFAKTGSQPLEVTYDELEAAPAETVGMVLRTLGLPRVEIAPPPLSRQRDEVSLAWIERYLSDRERAA